MKFVLWLMFNVMALVFVMLITDYSTWGICGALMGTLFTIPLLLK